MRTMCKLDELTTHLYFQTTFLHMNFVDLYKYKIGDTNNEPQKFEKNVAHWSIASHSSEDRLVRTLYQL